MSQQLRDLSIEFLESRYNLSGLTPGIDPAAVTGLSLGSPAVQDQSILNTGAPVGMLKFAGPLPQLFSAKFRNVVLAQVEQPDNSTTPVVPLNTTPSSPATPTTTDPTPAAVTVQHLVSFNALVIDGNSTTNSIFVSQSGQTLTVQDPSGSRSFTGTFGNVVVHAGSSNETITIDSSVNITTLLYGGAGNDTINAYGTGKATIVSIGGGADILRGNGVNTSYWADTSDTVNASAAEISAGRVHTISAFYQPWTTNTSDPNYISLQLNGQTLREPSDLTDPVVLSNHSLWGTGPVQTDVNQGQTADCYYLSDLLSLSQQQPDKLREMAVDLGDGTYAVEFQRNGVQTYVRVDGELPGSGGGLDMARPGPTGDLWAPIMEKAYSYFRSAANSYNSLNYGWTGTAFSDLGLINTSIGTTGQTADQLYNQFSTALAAGKAITLSTNTTIVGNAPLIASHAYSLYAVTHDSSGNVVFELRNPWGYDGAGNDSNPSDGIVSLTLAQLQANLPYGSVTV
jgi:hypothetical protein